MSSSSHGLRVLITNNTLDDRGGSELYVRDVAIALLRRGHKPIAYSTRLGPVAEELRAATVPVISDLSSLGDPPNIIHGQHHVETMTALLRFPDVPAISFCHGWTPWQEALPHFPRILRYIAVDDTCLDRIVLENGVPQARTRVLLNFVDLGRFRSRGPLPEKPKRALVFSNRMAENNGLRAVRDACRQHGLEMHVAGLVSGTASATPEALLPQFDIVFAKARCALEALAVGNAVILCDVAGCGPMITTANLNEFRRLNFGIRTLSQPVESHVLARQIACYDPGDAAEVSRIIRNEAGLDTTIDELVAIYRETIAEFAQAYKGTACDLKEEEKAAAAYLQQLGILVKGWSRPQEELRQYCHQTAAEVRRLQAELEQVYSSSRWRAVERLKRFPLIPGILRRMRKFM